MLEDLTGGVKGFIFSFDARAETYLTEAGVSMDFHKALQILFVVACVGFGLGFGATYALFSWLLPTQALLSGLLGGITGGTFGLYASSLLEDQISQKLAQERSQLSHQALREKLLTPNPHGWDKVLDELYNRDQDLYTEFETLLSMSEGEADRQARILVGLWVYFPELSSYLGASPYRSQSQRYKHLFNQIKSLAKETKQPPGTARAREELLHMLSQEAMVTKHKDALAATLRASIRRAKLSSKARKHLVERLIQDWRQSPHTRWVVMEVLTDFKTQHTITQLNTLHEQADLGERDREQLVDVLTSMQKHIKLGRAIHQRGGLSAVSFMDQEGGLSTTNTEPIETEPTVEEAPDDP